MRNLRFLVNEEFKASELAEDLRVQLEVNRFNSVKVLSVDNRNEVIVQLPEANGSLEEAVGSFMESYQSGLILE
ncbi:hypothetical protein [Mesobacillus harenae]|uniref:hypothetical protein n=1 Tax=Mesobacillus harenae TaxID=2213203 RepID=UPI001580531F|nr:hypothetical protein [Mesobacillus harenae]